MRFFVFASLILFLAGVQEAHAQRLGAGIYKHRGKTCSKGHLEGKYRYTQYEKDKRVGSASVIARADPIENASFPESASTQRVRFHVPVSGIKTDRVSLDRIGLSIFSTGEAICTGILNQNGGVDGGLSGSNVTIRARAYAGVRDTETLGDAIMVWETKHDAWVYKNRPLAITFAKPDDQDEQLKRFFPKITHMEIELEYTIDR